MPKCHWLPFFVWCISGSRSLSAFFVELGAAMIVASTIVPRFSSKPRSHRWPFTHCKSFGARSFASSRCRKFKIVVSSGIARVSDRCANWRTGAISYSASSIAGSLKPNQFCIR